MVAAAKPLFTSSRVDGDAMTMTMRWAQEKAGQVIDPHSAIGLAAARKAGLPTDVPVVTLATAHPAKFPDAVERATGVRPSLPSRIGGLFDRAEQFDILPATPDAIKTYVAERGTQGAA
jgi:threonine synthase